MHRSYLIKPASSKCNMACKYCFYKDETCQREVSDYGIMNLHTMENVIQQTLSLSDEVTYAFQGGEPTLAGLRWFESFIEVVKKYQSSQKIYYAIQTNGYQLSQSWVDFFRKHHFLVGVSLDGFREIHDDLRGHFQEIFKFIGLLKENQVDYNILTVLSDSLSQYPEQLYQFYKDNDFHYVQLIACLPELDHLKSDYALQPKNFYSFYSRFFKCWYEDLKKGDYMSVTLFDQLLLLFQGRMPSLCGMVGHCQIQYVIEASGDVYPCDFYCLDAYWMGNVNVSHLKEMTCAHFLSEEKSQSRFCSTCKFKKLCHGNCKRMNVTLFDDKDCYYRKFLEATYHIFYQLGNQK